MTDKKPNIRRRKDGSVSQGTSKAAAEARYASFVEAYLANGRVGKDAAIKAGYSAKSSEMQASRLLATPRVRTMLAERERAIAKKLEISTERVLREVARLAFFDTRQLFKPDGSPKAINELDDDTAAALAGLDVLEEFDGTGKDRVFVGYTKKYKLASKIEALDKLMKHMGMFDKDNAQKGQAEAEALREFFQSIYGPGNKLPIAKS